MKLLFLLALLIVLAASSTEIAERGEHEERNGSGQKVGLAWSYTEWSASNVFVTVGTGKKTTWYYTWSAWSVNANLKTTAEFVPMFHDPNSVGEFTQARDGVEFSNSKYVLHWNEPDLNGWSVASAVSAWKTYLEPLRTSKNLKLGAPAVTSDLSKGKPWLQSFISSCTGCNIAVIPLHWYGTNAQDFINYVTTMHNAFPSYEIWITEWACLSTNQNDIYNFMGQTTLWLDQQSYVGRFAWFGAMRSTGSYVPQVNALLTSNGQGLTGLGSQYFAVGGHS